MPALGTPPGNPSLLRSGRLHLRLPLQEKTIPFETTEESAAVAETQYREYAELAEERQLGELGDEFPYLAEVVAGHVAKVGYDFAEAFEYGIDLILDALERRREYRCASTATRLLGCRAVRR